MKTLSVMIGVLSWSALAFGAASPTVAFLPPTGSTDDAELGLLIQARAGSLLGAAGPYTVFHVKQILRMAEFEGLSPSQLSEPRVTEAARAHLGANRLGFAKLTPLPGGGWTFDTWVRDAKGADKHLATKLPAAFAAAIEAGAQAWAGQLAQLDGAKLPAAEPGDGADDAWRAYGRCYARIVRQPVGIENPTLLDEAELSTAVSSCRQALTLKPDWESARAGLAIALAIRGDDKQAVAELAKLSPDAKAHAFYWVARFWLVTRYESNEAGAGVLRKGIELAPRSLLLRGYLAEHLNAVGHHEEAVQAWKDYQKLAPDSPFVLARLGYTDARLHHYKEALAQTQAAVDKDPTSTNLKLELASRLIDAGLSDQAIQVLLPLSSPEARPEVVLRLGYAYLMHGDLDTAEPLIKRALDQAQKPSEWRTRARAKYDLAKLELRRGHPDVARGLILDALVAGYKPYSLAREDKDLMVVAKAAELEQQKKAPPKAQLVPQPKVASPFAVDGSGEIDPAQKRPPPPDGFGEIHFDGL